jgi:hypothetical protein
VGRRPPPGSAAVRHFVLQNGGSQKTIFHFHFFSCADRCTTRSLRVASTRGDALPNPTCSHASLELLRTLLAAASFELRSPHANQSRLWHSRHAPTWHCQRRISGNTSRIRAVGGSTCCWHLGECTQPLTSGVTPVVPAPAPVPRSSGAHAGAAPRRSTTMTHNIAVCAPSTPPAAGKVA